MNLPFDTGVDTKSKYLNAVTGYLMYQATEKLKLNGRVEYTSASNGYWYTPAADSSRARLLGVTGTIDYSLWKNVISRFEVRWDHSLNGDRPYNVAAGDPPDGLKNVVTLALNVIYNF